MTSALIFHPFLAFSLKMLLNLHSSRRCHRLQAVLVSRLAHVSSGFGAKNVLMPATIPSTSTPFPFRPYFLAKPWQIDEFSKQLLVKQMLNYASSAFLYASRLGTKARSSTPVRHTKPAASGRELDEDEEEERKAGRRRRHKETRPAKKDDDDNEDKNKLPTTRRNKRELTAAELEQKRWEEGKAERLKQMKEMDERMFKFVEKFLGKEATDQMRKMKEGTDETFEEYFRDPKNRRRVFHPLVPLLIVFGLFFMLISRVFPHAKMLRDPETGALVAPVPITWAEFLQRLLNSGQIEKLSAVDTFNLQDRQPYSGHHHRKTVPANVIVKMRPGAKAEDGKAFAPVYTLKVPDLRRLESTVRSAETANGLPPERWAEIELVQVNMLPGFIFMGLLMLATFFMFRRVYRDMGGAFGNIFSMMSHYKIRILDPAAKEAKKALKIRFRDVAGLHEAKVEISEFVDYLKRPGKYTKLGAKLPKGALLTGPPGSGKTLLAKALASESSVPFINVNGTEFVEMIGGLGASRVRQLFKLAKSRAPCIIYIDEIDAIGRRRQENQMDMNSSDSETEQTLNQLLVEMDGMDTAKGIVVIGSTNRPDVLDRALLRPGRFDRHVHIDLPTLAERKDIFDLYLKKIKRENRLTGVSQRLAQMTPGFSGADIANVVNEAAIHAATARKKMVQMEDVQFAMDKIIAGPEKRSRTLVKEEREVVAFHESGHALVGWLLEHTEALLKVTIIPRTSAAFGFAQYSPKDRKLFTREELFDRMCMMLGGRAAENVTFGRITTGAQNDLEKVTKKAQAMVKWYGMSETLGPISFRPGPGQDGNTSDFMPKPYSRKLANLIDAEVSKLVAEAYNATEGLLRANRDKLDKLAKSLLERETLSYEDVKALIGPPKFGDKSVVDLPEEVLPPNEEL